MSIRRLERQVDKLVKFLDSRRLKDVIGKQVISIIFKRVKKGFGVTSEFSSAPGQQRFDPLSTSYKAFRRRNSGKLARDTSPNKSNLTFTGELLKSMTYRRLKKRVKVMIPSTVRTDGLSNKRLKEILLEKGIHFMQLTKTEQAKLNRVVDREVNRQIRRLF